MEKSRKIELFEIIKENIKDNDFTRFNGICQVINFLYYDDKINETEKTQLKAILSENRPQSNPNHYFYEFTLNEYWDEASIGYWWQPMWYDSETKNIRVAYLEKLIEKIKETK